MVLVETSAWVEFDRATGSRVHLRVRELVASGEAATTEPVMMKVLAGARDDERERDLRRMLRGLELLGFDSGSDFDAAQRIYRMCRGAGVSPRGLIDCMIAAVAMRHRVPLLAQDADFELMSAVVALDLD